MRRRELARAPDRAADCVLCESEHVALVRLARTIRAALLQRQEIVEALDEEVPHHLVRQCGGDHTWRFCRWRYQTKTTSAISAAATIAVIFPARPTVLTNSSQLLPARKASHVISPYQAPDARVPNAETRNAPANGATMARTPGTKRPMASANSP